MYLCCEQLRRLGALYAGMTMDTAIMTALLAIVLAVKGRFKRPLILSVPSFVLAKLSYISKELHRHELRPAKALHVCVVSNLAFGTTQRSGFRNRA